MLVRRMSTLKRELLHVNDLMRDSMTRMQDFTPGEISVDVTLCMQGMEVGSCSCTAAQHVCNVH
jgi:flagellar hook-basal body complex protein FliE